MSAAQHEAGSFTAGILENLPLIMKEAGI